MPLYLQNIDFYYYLSRGLAKIEKTPEPMKPLGTKNRKGQFLATKVILKSF